MVKFKTLYVCEKCGAESPRWSGQCATCGEWNCLQEDVVAAETIKKKTNVSVPVLTTKEFSQISTTTQRTLSGIEEFDRVLGGGFVEDSITLLTGDPGIGKSTIALQAAVHIGKKEKTLYISGEESVEQIAQRAVRCGLSSDGISFANASNIHEIIATIDAMHPKLVVIDSIQVISDTDIPAASGTLSQIRAVTEQCMHIAKTKKIPIILIGHVTKTGEFSGPQLLAHLVDTVLFLEGERYHTFRLLRTTKNRFGATDEVGVFEMTEKGLEQVKNPSAAFLEGRADIPIGSAIIPSIEGTRPFLIELQALMTLSSYSAPKRTASGIDLNRVHLMIAVVEKFSGLKLSQYDSFVNVVGGFKLSDPAADLALCMALASSRKQIPLPKTLAVIGEVGLSGEIRTVSNIQKRVTECEKLGFTNILMPLSQQKSIQTKKANLIGVKTVQESLQRAFEANL